MEQELLQNTGSALEWTGERFLPHIHGDIELEHIHRYIVACELALNKCVLDIACGEGYGANLLANKASYVYGVDISDETIAFAKNKYQRSNLEFKPGTCSNIPLPDQSVDLVVSFETIEHHTHHQEMMAEIRRVLRPNGVVIISSPDKYEYSDVTGNINPFHFKELYRDEFELLLQSYFTNTKLLGQRVMFGSNIASLKQGEDGEYISYFDKSKHISQHPGINKPVYFIGIASDGELPKSLNSFYENQQTNWREKDDFIKQLTQQLNHLSQSLQEKDQQLATLAASLKQIYYSNSWRLCAPLRQIRKLLRENISYRPKMVLLKKVYRVYKIAGLGGVKNASLNFIRRKSGLSLTGMPHWDDPDRTQKNSTPLFDQLFAQACNEKTSHISFKTNKPIATDTKLIAFYLPQFHPIPENDGWWGKGFTEWTNVSKAVPQFSGHYQPHLPGELGFYDLRVIEVQKRQIELARNYGIHGFCYHYYWFSGRKLLSQPLETVLANPELDLPFCLCWANENWTRRWDGLENEILIKQTQSTNDDVPFIKDIEKALRDSRYIRINGRPLLIIYRVSLLPDVAFTVKKWREYCIASGIGDLYLAAAQTFETDTIPDGFDALVEFPPHYLALGAPAINSQLTMINPNYNGNIVDYNYIVDKANTIGKPKFTLLRTVFPSWDNEPRKPGRGFTFANSSPVLYGKWLRNAIAYTCKNNDEKIVFINAWNEWGEGAHLEPDRKYGYAWLQATYEALAQTCHQQRKIILVSHDAHPHGAQYLALGLAKVLATDFNFHIDLILLGEGPLIVEFAKWCHVHSLADLDIQRLVDNGHTAAIVNTTVSGNFLETLAQAGLRCVSLVHELPGIIEAYNLHSAVQTITKHAHTIVFPAPQVADAFNPSGNFKDNQIKIRPQGLIKKNLLRNQKEFARTQLRQKLGLNENAKIILGMGYADHRKGIDLFIEMGLNVLKTLPHAYLVWVGHWEATTLMLIKSRLANNSMIEHFFLNGFDTNTDVYFTGADIFALTSREDPFPSVVLQSLEVSVPVVGFTGAGGFTTLLEQGCGTLVPKENTQLFAQAIIDLLEHPERAHQLGAQGAALIEKDYSFHHYAYDLLDWAGLSIKRVSAIVPNYNYARHLKARLMSIINQSHPVFEIIVLDDASTDNSLEVIEQCLANTNIEHRVIKNDRNSGSVSAQWQKGIQLARGEFVWMCEADDFADPAFVERVVSAFDDEQVVMSYSQSRQIDEQGRLISNDYLEYTDDICEKRWREDYIRDGHEELTEALSVKNTVPNVSAVIFRKSILHDAIKTCQSALTQLKVAGDWLIYTEVLKNGKIAFISASLNSHRRHAESVTHSSLSDMQHLSEIIYMQKHVAKIVNLSKNTTDKADGYAKRIKIQFGLDNHPRGI